MLNDQELCEHLASLARDFGLTFEVFDGSASGFSGAASQFPRAMMVVGVHGAGLANTLFCRPGTVLLELGLPEPEVRGPS